ncbi:MAG: hypothetical protein LAP40_08660 [Acidobacteriia bacterium]|nr:hypothetical protein [Terriglobia bacterium]
MNHFISNFLRTGSSGRFLGLAAALLLAVSAFAADVDGKWAGTVSTPNGDIPQAFTFKADGATLTGSMTGMDGAQIAIKDGKVDGANISFSVTLDFGGMPFTLSFKGVVAADQIKLTGDAAGQAFQLVVKKAAS